MQREYDELYSSVKELVQKDSFHYEKLLDINRILWHNQDKMYESPQRTKDLDSHLLNVIIVENQRRFRLKKTLNDNLSSKHREQKGYKATRAFVLSHLGMGDHFFMNGAIRYLASQFDEVLVVVKHQYLKNVQALFSNEPSVSLYPIENDSDISPHFGCPLEKFKKTLEGFDFIGLCGYHRHTTPLEDFPLSFYDDLGIQRDIIHTWSNIPCSTDDTLREPHIFYHNKASNFEAQIPVNIDEKLVINPSVNMYSEGHQWYEVAQAWVGRPILDYVNVMRTSHALYMVDSSFFCMALMLGLNPEVWSRGGRSYANLRPDLVEHTV